MIHKAKLDKIFNIIRTTSHAIFSVAVFFLLLFFILEYTKPGIFSNWINLHWLLLVVSLIGLFSLGKKNDLWYESMRNALFDKKRYGYIFITFCFCIVTVSLLWVRWYSYEHLSLLLTIVALLIFLLAFSAKRKNS